MLRFWLLAGFLAVQPLRGEIALTGSVVHSNGAPVADARVELLPALDSFEAGRRILSGSLEPPPYALATSDEGGRYRLTVPHSGVWRLVVRAAGFVPMHLVYLPVTEDRELAPLALTIADEMRARVVDAEGRGRAGLWVWAETADSKRWLSQKIWQPQFRGGPTDAEGWIVLPRATGERLHLQAVDGGAILASLTSEESIVQLTASEPAGWRSLELHPEASAVEVLIRTGPLDWPAGLLKSGLALNVVDLADDDQRMSVVTADGLRQKLEIPVTAPNSSWRVTPPTPISFTGRVLDASNGRPIADSLLWLGADPAIFAHASADGRYRLNAPTRDRFWLQAEAPGYRPRATWITSDQAAAGQAPSLALIPAVELPGRVLGARDQALTGAQLAVTPRRRQATDHAYFSLDPADSRANSGSGGRFHLNSLEPGRAYTLQVSHPGYATTRLEVVAPEAATTRPVVSKNGAPGQTDVRLAANLAPRPTPELVVRLTPSQAGGGLVIDEQERPIVGAEVILTASGERRPSPGSGEEMTPHRGVSDKKGRFRISGVPAEVVDITVFKKGYAPLWVRGIEIPATTATASGPVDLGTLILAPAATVNGRVTDPQDRGLSEVPIFIVPPKYDPENMPDPLAELLDRRGPATQTDAEGLFQLEDLSAGDRFHLYAGGVEQTGAWVKHIEVPLAEPLHIVLEPGLSLFGRVVDDHDQPIASAELQLSWTERLKGLDAPSFQPGNKIRRTDPEGRFAFGGLKPGVLTLNVWAEGFQEAEPQTIELSEDGPTDELTVVLERGATLTGEVRTASGQPVDGVRVAAGRPGTFSDAEGRYRLDGITPGEVLVEAYHPHYGRAQETVEIELGDYSLDLTFDDGSEVRGQVVDGSGNPVPGVSLQLDSGGFRGALVYRTHSDDEGFFEISPVSEGEYQVQARSSGWVLRGPRTIRVGQDGVDDARIVLEPSAVVRGEVLGLDFDQLTRLQVSAGGEEDGLVRGDIDYTGSYEIRDLEPGYWIVRATLDGGRRQVQERIEIPPGGAEIQRDLRFDDRFVLTGTVLLDGEPLPGAKISVTGRDLAVRREVASDFAGQFRIDDLERATYNLGVAHSREQVVHNRDLELDSDRDVLIDLAPARLTGRVVDVDNGQTLPGALVRLARLSSNGDETNALIHRSDVDGAFDFPRAPPGSYRVGVRLDGYAEATWSFDLADGETRDVELEVQATPGAQLRVRLADGSVPATVFVVIQDAGGGAVLRQSRPVDADGSVDLSTIPEGVFRVLAQSPGTVLQEASLEVPSAPVELILEPAGRLDVRVPDLITSDVVAVLEIVGPGAQPWVGLSPYGQLADTWRVVGGRTEVDGLPAGFWSLRVTGVDGQTWDGTVNAVPGTQTHVELR